MKFKLVVSIALFVCVVTACSAGESLSPPEQAYYNFLQACAAGDMSEVETYLTDKAVQAFQIGWLPCETYLQNGLYSNGSAFEWVDPDSVEYRDWDTDEMENQTGLDSGYDGVLEVADIIWFVEGKVDPLGENSPSDNTTYISSIEVMLININGEWKIDCGNC